MKLSYQQIISKYEHHQLELTKLNQQIKGYGENIIASKSTIARLQEGLRIQERRIDEVCLARTNIVDNINITPALYEQAKKSQFIQNEIDSLKETIRQKEKMQSFFKLSKVG